MRPLRVRERTLADGSIGYSVDGSPDGRREPRVPRLLRPRLRPRRVGHQLRREPRRRHHVLGDRQRSDGGGDQRLPGRSRSARSITSIPTSPWPAIAATIVARNILEHGLSRGELINVNVPAVHDRGMRGHRGHPAGPARLPGPARRAARPARDPLLLDRRAAAVGPRGRGHGLPRRRQPPDRDHADPSRPDGAAPAPAVEDLELAAAVRGVPRAWLRLRRMPSDPVTERQRRRLPRSNSSSDADQTGGAPAAAHQECERHGPLELDRRPDRDGRRHRR